MGQSELLAKVDAARRTRRLEGVALGFLAALPVVPYLTFLLRTGVPRYGLAGDWARVEHATRHVWAADTLVGTASSYDFSQPGPLFFYFAAPFQALFGASSTGIYVATCVIAAAAAATIVASARLFARRAHAAAALVVVLAWFAAFGNAIANPWNPLVVGLPLLSFLVSVSLLARGKSGAIYPAVLFGSFVMQTWVFAAGTVLAGGLVGLVSFLVSARSRGPTEPGRHWLNRDERFRLSVAFAIGLVTFALPLVDQLVSPIGNFTKLWRFFLHRETPLTPLGTATEYWATATSWLPSRFANGTLFREGVMPFFTEGDAVAVGLTRSAKAITMVHVTAMAVSAIVAARRRDVVSISLLGFGALAEASAVVSLQSTIGPIRQHALFWTTASSTVALIGVLSIAFSSVVAIFSRYPRANAVGATLIVFVSLSATITTTTLQRHWLSKNPIAPGSRPALREDLLAARNALGDTLQKKGATPVVHLEGAKDIAVAIVLELEKDLVDVRISNSSEWKIPGTREGKALDKPLHVYLATEATPLGIVGCVDLISKSGDISIYGSPTAVTTCPQ